MRTKTSVRFKDCKPETYVAIGVAEVVWGNHGVKLVVTSVNDSRHTARHPTKAPRGSLHYLGYAVDLRIKNIYGHDVVLEIVDTLKKYLEPIGYDVVLEKDHVHVEFDPKPGEKWITEVA